MCQTTSLKLFVYSGRSIVSKVIKLVTGSQYSHVAVCVGTIGEIPITIEAWKGFVRLGDPRPVHRNNTKYFEYTFTIPLHQQNQIFEFLSKQVNKRYDFLAMLYFLLTWRFGKKEKFKEVEHKDKWFCSELIAAAVNTVNPVFPSMLVSPAELVDRLKQKEIVI